MFCGALMLIALEWSVLDIGAAMLTPILGLYGQSAMCLVDPAPIEVLTYRRFPVLRHDE